MEYRIRLKGSFTLYLVNMTDNLSDEKNRLYTQTRRQPSFNPFEFTRRLTAIRKKDSIMVNGKAYEREDIMKLNLFLYDKIELPFNCKFSLSKEEEISLSQ